MLTAYIMVTLWLLTNSANKMKMPLCVTVLSMALVHTITQLYHSTTLFCHSTMISSASNLSLAMVILSMWVTSMMFMVSMKYQQNNMNPQLFKIMAGVLLMVIMLFFITDNTMVLYIMFEASLIPTLVLVIKWGYQPERLSSGFYFMMYTICASLPLLMVILGMKSSLMSYSMNSVAPMHIKEFKCMHNLSFMALVMAFMVKAPMWGVHLWLPKAHVEAPVSGSMILAGILLKLGGYGLMQMMKLTYKLISKMTEVLFSINMWGALIVGLICLSSIDMKSLIAYSSVIHMNVMILGLLSNTTLGTSGAILMMIAHGISSPGMFAMANLNYQKTKSRNIMMQKGLLMAHPKMALFWFMLAAANMAAPPSINLASEIMIYASVLKVSFSMMIVVGLITFLGGAYNLYLYASQQGNSNKNMTQFSNMNSSEMTMALSHSVLVYALIVIMFAMY